MLRSSLPKVRRPGGPGGPGDAEKHIEKANKNMPGMDRNIALFARHHIIFLELYIYICKNTYTHILHILCNLYNFSGVWTACGRHWMV